MLLHFLVDTRSVQDDPHLFNPRYSVELPRYQVVGNKSVFVKIRSQYLSLEEFLYLQPPSIRFVDGSYLFGNNYIQPKKIIPLYPVENVMAWDWAHTNIRTKSQGVSKRVDSVQYRVIEQLKQESYQVIFDDDTSGEAADVVTVRLEDLSIVVEFYHCKFSSGDQPGARVGDLYEVCGQAQKSIYWMEKPSALFAHLLRREEIRRTRGEASRIERGTENDLVTFMEMVKTHPFILKIFIVQPGLSKASASHDQLALLGVTRDYLIETCQLPLGVIASS